MLKKFLLFIFGIAFVCMLSGCSSKEPVTETEFVSILEEAGYEILNAVDSRAEIKAVAMAAEPDGRFIIEFYVYTSAKEAGEAFRIKKNYFEGLGTWYAKTEINAGSVSSFKGTNNGTYYAYARIADTIIYVQAYDEDKNAVNEILTALGY